MTTQVPKGPGTQHHAEGLLEIAPEFEEGLLDIEGFSHLFVIWIFDRSEGYALTGVPPTDDRPHGVFATRSPYRPPRMVCRSGSTPSEEMKSRNYEEDAGDWFNASRKALPGACKQLVGSRARTVADRA